jgi:putative transposase
MLIHKAYKTRMYPTEKQQKQFTHHFGSARWVYNYFLQYKTDQYKLTSKSATYIQMSKILTELKQQPEYAWLNGVSRQCTANSLRNLDVAFNKFFNKKTKYPKFKKKTSKQSFKTSSPICSIRQGGVHLPQIGLVKCKLKLPKEYKFYSTTISRETTGKYFISINYTIDIPEPVIDKKKPIIGIDFGLKTFITTSNGNKIDHPKPLNNMLHKLKRLSRELSRRKKGSNRRSKTKRKLALCHEKIKSIRLDFLHKLSRRMVGENQAIYLEDLSIKGMGNRFGKQLQDLGWGEFTRQLSYKGLWFGCQVSKIDRFFPSSKTCSTCGCVKNNLTLGDRVWACLRCGAHHDRDVNAAKNVLEYGRVDRN